MAVRDPLSRPRGVRLVASVALGLLLAFGGTCGAGPTSLSLLAVSSPQVPTPDDARGQVPVPAATEVAEPARRVVRRRLVGVGRAAPARFRARFRGTVVSVLAHLRAPPLRGPPALAA